MDFKRYTTPYLTITHKKVVVDPPGAWRQMAKYQAEHGYDFYLERMHYPNDSAFCHSLAESNDYVLTLEPADSPTPYRAVFTKIQEPSPVLEAPRPDVRA